MGSPSDSRPIGQDGFTVVRVEDAGAQIVGPERRRIFQRFHRGSGAAERSSGAGLGLTIARELAEAQGGALELESGRAGTSFVLSVLAHTTGGGQDAQLGRLVSGQMRRSP